MAPGSLSRLLQPVRDAAGRQIGPTTSDSALLERFVRHRDEAAFELLVWRHDRMVNSVCRRVLGRRQDVEDAWQATFLTLACKAGDIGDRRALAGWLYKVAFRIALRLRRGVAKREQGEPAAGHMDAVTASDELTVDVARREFQSIVHEEISRLPAKYRTPVVLCYIEGKTNEEAARQLGCPTSTVVTWLARARDRLRSRLTRRGLGATTATVAAALAGPESVSASSPALLQSTVGAALVFANDRTAAGLVSTRVALLTKGALHTMFLNRMRLVAAIVMGVGLAGAGSGLLAFRALADDPGSPPPVAGRPQAPNANPPRPAEAAQFEVAARPADDKDGKDKPKAKSKPDGQQKAEEVVTKSFKTGKAPSVTLEVFNGGITIVADAADAVDARLTKQARAATEEEAKEGLKNIEIDMKQDKDTVTITARRREKDRVSQESVSAEVRVPAGAVLDLRTDNGGVQVTGGTGNVAVQTANGSIQVKDGKGPMRLTTRNGSIAASGATGRVELSTSNGRIDLQAEKAVVTAHTSNGEVRFSGSLADGKHSLTTSNGRLQLTLPAGARFRVDATTSLGAIENDFGEGASARVGGVHLQTTVGDDPKATIMLKTSNGGIEIRKKKD
ncbi:MAG TPA: sigma-70 family RNA polymerase sigma factor [Gemmataceae bacterium]|nr:sigma-70 family RNA polymerase sigma factor [Gemmataceae bacterium]